MEKFLATLDTTIQPSGTLPPRGGLSAREPSVHAEDARSLTSLSRLKLGQRQIARSACLSQSTVHDYLERFAESGPNWPLPSGMTETQLEAALFAASAKPRSATTARPPPDFVHLHEELQRNKHLTLQLLWEEYQAANPGGRKSLIS